MCHMVCGAIEVCGRLCLVVAKQLRIQAAELMASGSGCTDATPQIAEEHFDCKIWSSTTVVTTTFVTNKLDKLTSTPPKAPRPLVHTNVALPHCCWYHSLIIKGCKGQKPRSLASSHQDWHRGLKAWLTPLVTSTHMRAIRLHTPTAPVRVAGQAAATYLELPAHACRSSAAVCKHVLAVSETACTVPDCHVRTAL